MEGGGERKWTIWRDEQIKHGVRGGCVAAKVREGAKKGEVGREGEAARDGRKGKGGKE